MTIRERRSAVRTPAKLAMEVTLAGEWRTRVRTLNVSASGVYFTSPRYIATMTKLEITLLLPHPEMPRKDVKVPCVGIVVRVEPEAEEEGCTEYQIACYFTSVSPESREHLENYILAQLAI